MFDRIYNLMTEQSLIIQIIIIVITLMSIYYIYNYLNQSSTEQDNEQINEKEPFQNYVTNKGILADGKYVIRGGRNQRFCSDDPNGIICIADTPGPREIFTIQHLEGELYAIQGFRSGLWCGLTSTGLRCESPVVCNETTFKIHPLGDNVYCIQSNRNKKFCVDSGYGLVCDTDSMYNEGFQKFEIIPIDFANIK